MERGKWYRARRSSQSWETWEYQENKEDRAKDKREGKVESDGYRAVPTVSEGYDEGILHETYTGRAT